MRHLALILALSCVVQLGCGGGKTDSKNPKTKVSKLAGKILIEGSSTVQPISLQAKQQFNVDHPDVEISVGGEGTSNGFKSFVKSITDISDASRPIKPQEVQSCKENEVEFIELPVAYDGLTFVVNNKNEDVNELTVDQLKKIFVEGGAKTWKEVNDAWPDEEIEIFMPGTGSGTYDYAHEILAKKDKKQLRSEASVTMSEQDNTLVDGVKKSQWAIGFFGFAYYEANKNDLKAIKIVNPATSKAVLPAMETIESGEYAPFSRPLLIYLNKKSLSKLQVQKFVEFYLENAKKLAEDAKYVALPESIYAIAKQNLEDMVTGTHFLDEKGEKRSGSLTEIYKAGNAGSQDE